MAARRGRGHNAFIMNKSTYPHPLRSRIRAGELVLGSVLSAPYASVAAQTCGTGIDFLWIDTEHQPYGAEAGERVDSFRFRIDPLVGRFRVLLP